MNQIESDLNIEPNNPSGSEIIGKTLIGLIIGIIVAFAIFIIIILVGKLFKEAFLNRVDSPTGSNATSGTTNPLLPFILILIAFITSLVGNIITVGIYNFFFNNKYYDLLKMFSLVLIINILLFFILLPLYVIFFNSILNSFFLLTFHILFSVYVSTSILEFFTNPNYCGSNLIGTTLGFSITAFVFLVIYKFLDMNNPDTAINILLIAPSLLAYTIIPLATNVWQKLYYKFYQAGNNFLYIPSMNEVMVESEEIDDINVE